MTRREFADVVTKEGLEPAEGHASGIRSVPPLEGGAPFDVVAERLPPRIDTMKELVARYRDPGPDPSVDNRLKVMNEGRQATLWDGLIDPDAPDFAGSKINLAVGKIHAEYVRWNKHRGARLVFRDLSTPRPGSRDSGTAPRAGKGKGVLVEDDDDDADYAPGSADKDSLLAERLSSGSGVSVYEVMKTKLTELGIPPRR
jgi:hypothetical protein